MMCTVMELCEQDDIYNDGHTDHEAEQDAHNENTCVSQAGYIFPSSVDKSNLKPDEYSLAGSISVC